MGSLLRRAGLAVLVLGLLALAGGVWLWNDRPDLEALEVPMARTGAGSVTVRWLGVTTLLFDDGETRLLTDGFFSRPGLLDLLLDRPIAPDLAGIERALARLRVDRLAAVMPVHSHFDHAMDAGEVAKRTGALVLGSESTANVARGAGLPEARSVRVADGESHRFGRFTVRFHRSRHLPIGADGAPPIPGSIDAPLVPPAPVTAWREGGSWSIEIAHPAGTALVQGSAGYVEAALADVRADVVLLGVGGLARLGEPYAGDYWREIVAATGARRVLPVHHDDFTRPWGEVRAWPRAFDDTRRSLGWLRERAGREGVRLEMLPFAEPVPLFGLAP